MVNASEVGHSPEENEVPKDLASQVRDFNQKITELIRKVESQEGVTNKEMAEIDREYDALDASLSDQSFDSDETGKLYDNFQKRIPSRIARLKEKLGQLNSPVSTIAAVQGSETNLGAVNTDTSREANESTSPETIDVWPPDFVTEIRNILYRRRDQFKAEFYPNGDYILDSNFDFTDPDSVQVLHNLEAVLDQLKTVDPDTGKSELSIIETKKKTVEKTLKFLENSSKVSDVLKHEELEALIKEIDDFLTGYRTLEIDLYQELAPIIHPEIRSLIETDLSPDLSGATTPAQKFEVYKNFAFNTYEPEVEKNIGAIAPIIKQLENDNKEGHSQAITDKYVKPAKDEVENWKTVAFDYWEENLADLYPTIFNDALPDSYSQVISSYGDSRLFAMDIEDLFNAKARIEETLRIAKVLLDSEVSAGRVPSSQMDVRYQNLINEQYQR
ncbi:MAG: hypothetical protein QG639_112, partial [Patescibacteria group bacterium]|nr:hypothetical protein [Patescibacteria group bacterium]